MKVALDSILKLQPEGDVCAIGILVHGMFLLFPVECFLVFEDDLFISFLVISMPAPFSVLEPLVEFYTMRIHAEATYIMNKFASAYIVPAAMNAFPLVHLMEVFEHAKAKVEKTVDQLRRVKIHASLNPKVPLSWLRPSFMKPKLLLIVNGQ